jgi:hypothetical protein
MAFCISPGSLGAFASPYSTERFRDLLSATAVSSNFTRCYQVFFRLMESRWRFEVFARDARSRVTKSWL